MEILKTENLTKYYSGIPAINDVSLNISTGKIYGLLGPNGSGKSTFMRTVAGFCSPAKGSIVIDGEPIGVSSKAKVAYMPTESYFYGFMTIKDAKEYYADFFQDFDCDRFDETLAFMQLDENMKIKSLSSGMNAKLRVALTMSRDALLYMLDEPLNGIDLIARDAIMSTIIGQLSSRNAIIISSHLISSIEQIVDRVIFIKSGNIVVDEDAEKIREEKSESIMGLYREVFAL